MTNFRILVISLKFWNLGDNELVSKKCCLQHPSFKSVIKIDIYNFSDLHLNDQKQTFRVLVNSKELDNSVYRCIRSLLLKCELNCSRDKRKCAIKHSLSMFFTHRGYRKQGLLLTIIPANRKIWVQNLIFRIFSAKNCTNSKNIFQISWLIKPKSLSHGVTRLEKWLKRMINSIHG